MTPNQLPPLPEPFALSVSVHDGDTPAKTYVECLLYRKHPNEKQRLYTADQMHSYALAALAQQAQELVGDRYFSYSTDMGFEEFATQQEAIDCSNVQINGYREDAIRDDEWPDEVDSVCWGVILGRSKEIDTSNEDHESVDYKLYTAPPSPQPAAPVVSDEQIDAATRHMYHNGRPTTKEYRVGIVRAILALRPAVEPMTPFTPSQRMRLWQNTEKGKSATSLGAFERICQTVEAAHRIGQESPQPAVPVVEAFAEGWKMAADWANRDDLLPDMDSPQYAKERDERLAELRPAVEPMTWPKARDVGRYGDMHPREHIRVGLDSDNDAYVSVWGEDGGASVEFCNPGGGGGGSSRRTREALIALMVAIEADNAERPDKDWWARRNGIAAKAEGGA